MMIFTRFIFLSLFLAGEIPQINGYESCHHYHGFTCTDFLEDKLLYYTQFSLLLEENLSAPLAAFKQKLSPPCKQHAMTAMCHYAFPYCSYSSKPIHLCREDCEQLYTGVCKQDFEVTLEFEYLAKIMPDCEKLPSAGPPGNISCTTLNVPDS